MTGETGFNEVIFEDLVIEDKYRLDEVGAGWKVAMTTLAHERGAGMLVTPAAGGMTQKTEKSANTSSPSALIELAKNSYRNGKTAADDPLVRDDIVKMIILQNLLALIQLKLQQSILLMEKLLVGIKEMEKLAQEL